ncbi:MAG: cytochrome c maturation protein CcmE [Marinobacter sp.]|uniref:cytochrome c maturation protein CcmE n=1 Tax=Marinobacter sp. TaxID=50741 RepID=UPI00299F3A62|nr:cytochrome c maturation protein CcmE [Marinobacter sp.]MDX1635841.1 cytochrome c maturation protein CcmE [Marinobacter sp.]
MHPIRRKRLFIVLFLLTGLGLAIGLTTYALRQNINLFYDPSQIVSGEAPKEVRIRAGGMVEEGSVKRAPDSLDVAFRVTDYNASVTMQYTGILPDLFAEGQGVVATGMLRPDGVFVAEQVLAKHDEQYMPPEVSESLERAAMRKAQSAEAPAAY